MLNVLLERLTLRNTVSALMSVSHVYTYEMGRVYKRGIGDLFSLFMWWTRALKIRNSKHINIISGNIVKLEKKLSTITFNVQEVNKGFDMRSAWKRIANTCLYLLQRSVFVFCNRMGHTHYLTFSTVCEHVAFEHEKPFERIGLIGSGIFSLLSVLHRYLYVHI